MAKATLASASLALATPFRTLNSGLSDVGLGSMRANPRQNLTPVYVDASLDFNLIEFSVDHGFQD